MVIQFDLDGRAVSKGWVEALPQTHLSRDLNGIEAVALAIAMDDHAADTE